MILINLALIAIANKRICISCSFINSRTAIAWAIIGLLLVFFYNSKNLNCIGALSFLRLEEEYWRSSFFKSILLEWFLKRETKRVKKFGVIFVLNKSEERSENRVVFVHTVVFERARNWCVKKFSLSERNFFVHVRLLKAVFLQLLMVIRFDYDIVLVLGLFRLKV